MTVWLVRAQAVQARMGARMGAAVAARADRPDPGTVDSVPLTPTVMGEGSGCSHGIRGPPARWA